MRRIFRPKENIFRWYRTGDFARQYRHHRSPPLPEKRLSASRVGVPAQAPAGLLVRVSAHRSVLGDHQARRHHPNFQAAEPVPKRPAPAGDAAGVRDAAGRGAAVPPSARHGPARPWRIPRDRQQPFHAARREPSPARDRERSRARCSTTRWIAKQGDFVIDMSSKVPLAVIAELLGVPHQDWDQLFRWTNETIGVLDPEFQAGANEEQTFDRARMGLFSYFLNMTEERHQASAPTTSLASSPMRRSRARRCRSSRCCPTSCCWWSQETRPRAMRRPAACKP